MSIEAYCTKCDLWIPSGVENLATNTTFIGMITRCPQCKEVAQIPDGVYNLSQQIVQFFHSVNLSPDERQLLLQILETAQANNSEIKELQAIIDERLPKVSGLTKFWREGWNSAALFSLFAAILMYLYPMQPSPASHTPACTPPTVHTSESKRSVRRNRGKLQQMTTNPTVKKPKLNIQLNKKKRP